VGAVHAGQGGQRDLGVRGRPESGDERQDHGGIRYLLFDTEGPNAKKTLEMLSNTYYGKIEPSEQFPAVRAPGHIIGYDFALWTNKSVPDDVVMEVAKALHENTS
jgi:hypothetical protein